MTPTRYDLRDWGRLIKTIFKNFPNIYTYLGTNLGYIPVVISKSAHPIVHGSDISWCIQSCLFLYLQYDLYCWATVESEDIFLKGISS
jgi:hypothetical protein